ncbi:MAG TPA: ATP synthase F1 subunit gamma [Thermodesulfobacteriota bacterium]|nr:ATP synthase F1 subunit gamma [Thermodesulfobacteriota bacterium]
MASLRDIQRRIKSVKNTQQITKAMKMVSAAKLKRAQDDITAARPYAEKMRDLITSLAAKTSSESHPLLAERGGDKVGLILITSDRGLCGSFNAVLLRTSERFLRERSDSETALYLLGKRSIEYFKRREIKRIKTMPVGSRRPEYSTAAAIAREVIALYSREELDEVNIIFSEFKSVLNQRPIVQKLLPITAGAGAEGGEGEGVEVIYEPSIDAVLESLLPKYIEVQVYRALLESSASEHGARMTAMDSASRNAKEMIRSLTLTYNRLRQAAITKELMEIIGGAEALKG